MSRFLEDFPSEPVPDANEILHRSIARRAAVREEQREASAHRRQRVQKLGHNVRNIAAVATVTVAAGLAVDGLSILTGANKYGYHGDTTPAGHVDKDTNPKHLELEPGTSIPVDHLLPAHTGETGHSLPVAQETPTTPEPS